MPYKLKSKKLAYNRIYYKANRNKLLALKRKTSKKIYIRNRKKILEKGKVYRQTHQKEISLRIKKWRKQNPHKVKTYWQKSVKKYRICHPERVQSTQKKSYIKNKIKRLLYTKEKELNILG